MLFYKKRAFDALSLSTHLFGRRLVLEWAEPEQTQDVEILRHKEEILSGKLLFVFQKLLSLFYFNCINCVLKGAGSRNLKRSRVLEDLENSIETKMDTN
jgi:hypothetical protein